MNARQPLVRLSLAAAAAALALAGCHRNDTTGSTTASTATDSSSTQGSSSTTPSGTGITPSTMPSTTASTGTTSGMASTDTSASPGSMVTNSPTAAVSPSGGGAPLSGFDKTFVTKAAEGGMFEVEVGKLARDKGTDQAVKDFGQKLVDDHGAANDKLKSIASNHNETLPSSLPPDKQKELDRLSKLSGAAFDRELIQSVGLKDHKTDIALFEKASRDAKSDDLRDFAKSTLPTLHQHLSTATKLPARKSG